MTKPRLERGFEEIVEREPMTRAELRAIRFKLDISQTMAGQLVGVAGGTFQEWENGRRPINETAARFLRLLIATRISAGAAMKMTAKAAKL